jgi:hypothetical protein
LAFSNFISNVEFLSEEEIKNAGQCQISHDTTYGVSEENPIKVGG